MPDESESPSVGWRDMRHEMGADRRPDHDVGDSPWLRDVDGQQDSRLTDFMAAGPDG